MRHSGEYGGGLGEGMGWGNGMGSWVWLLVASTNVPMKSVVYLMG